MDTYKKSSDDRSCKKANPWHPFNFENDTVDDRSCLTSSVSALWPSLWIRLHISTLILREVQILLDNVFGHPGTQITSFLDVRSHVHFCPPPIRFITRAGSTYRPTRTSIKCGLFRSMKCTFSEREHGDMDHSANQLRSWRTVRCRVGPESNCHCKGNLPIV